MFAPISSRSTLNQDNSDPLQNSANLDLALVHEKRDRSLIRFGASQASDFGKTLGFVNIVRHPMIPYLVGIDGIPLRYLRQPRRYNRRRISHDSFEVQASQSRLLFHKVAEDTLGGDAPRGVPATSGYVVTFALTVAGCLNLRVP